MRRHEDAHEGLTALLDAVADATSGEFERLRSTANTIALTPLQWRTLLRIRRAPRGRRSRQVRGQRARCGARVERRDAAAPRVHTVGAALAAERRRDLTLYGEHVRVVGPSLRP